MNHPILKDAQIKQRGMEVLSRVLGPLDAYRFLALLHREPTDYVQVSRKIYQGQTVDAIFQRAKKPPHRPGAKSAKEAVDSGQWTNRPGAEHAKKTQST